MITIFVSKNSSAVSWLIRKITKEPVSHFGLTFDGSLVFHSNFLGAHPTFRNTFKKKNTIVWEITIPATLEQEEAVFQKCLELDEANYDFLALIHSFLSRLNKIIFNVRVPKVNAWNQKKEYICLEVAEALKPILPIDWDLSADTPWSTFNKIAKMVNQNLDQCN